jgi:prepilin-type N-terminal cleavage/methylation domain-containing protein
MPPPVTQRKEATRQSSPSVTRSRRGFTLVELIVVIVILGILAALAIPALTGYINKAEENALLAATRTSANALQAWASEQYAKGNVGSAGLINDEGDPVSLVSYSGEFAMFGQSADTLFGQGIHADSDSVKNGDGLTLLDMIPGDEIYNNGKGYKDKAYNSGLGGSGYLRFNVTYHLIDEKGKETLVQSLVTVSMWSEYPQYTETYADFALGTMGLFDNGAYYYENPDLPEGYSPREDTRQLIESGDSIGQHQEPSKDNSTIDFIGYLPEDPDYYNQRPYYDLTYDIDLYYEKEPASPSTNWVKIVDTLASTSYVAEGYLITEVVFTDQNLLTHMKFTSPKGDYAVFSSGEYYFNNDPGAGSSV